MFKFLKKLFAAEKAHDFAQAAQLSAPIHALPFHWPVPVREISEHQRNRQRFFSRVAEEQGTKTANDALEAFDKAFPDPDQAVRLPRPTPHGLVCLEDVKAALDAAGIKHAPWGAVL